MNRIKEVRISKKLSQLDLANDTGLTRQTISLYEKGEREPKGTTWQKLADALDVSVQYLQGSKDAPEVYLDVALQELDRWKNRTDRTEYEQKALHFFSKEQERELCLRAIISLQNDKFYQNYHVVDRKSLGRYVHQEFLKAYRDDVRTTQSLVQLVKETLDDLSVTVDGYAELGYGFHDVSNSEHQAESIIATLNSSAVTEEAIEELQTSIQDLYARVNKLTDLKDGPNTLELSVTRETYSDKDGREQTRIASQQIELGDLPNFDVATIHSNDSQVKTSDFQQAISDCIADYFVMHDTRNH